jgi:hypothetical protein
MSTRKTLIALALAAAAMACDGMMGPEPQVSMEAAGPLDGPASIQITSSRTAEEEKYAHVQMNCKTMVGVYEIDPLAAREALPPEYDLALQPSGNALVYLQSSKCEGTGNGTDISPFDLADVWLVIDGPFEVDPVPGAWGGTLPTLYVYVLKAQTTSEWIKETTASVHFQKELVKGLHMSDIPPRAGGVVEQTGVGWEWSEFLPCLSPPGTSWGECWMFPGMPVPVGYELPALPIGYNLRGYIDQGNGTGAKKEMSCVLDMIGQGIVELNVDPRSHLMGLGIFKPSQTGLSFDAIAHCDLLMTQN